METIGSGNYVILVCSYKINSNFSESELYKWLINNGYKNVSTHGLYNNCPWIYINIELKRYFPGMPGIKVTDCLNDHAVTEEEFYKLVEEFTLNADIFPNTLKTIEIYQKYKDKALFVFNKERFDYDLEEHEEQKRLFEQKNRKDINLTLCQVGLTKIKIKTLDEDEVKFEIDKSGLKIQNLPISGTYKALLHQQSIPGDEYCNCRVIFFEKSLTLITDGYTNGSDYFVDLKIYNIKYI
ncbi:MAG: hypothetical protein J5798_04065 [Spirochaetaceae bacterium]|nr:hypothetical protein [Spirochaetaceae bacterium]